MSSVKPNTWLNPWVLQRNEYEPSRLCVTRQRVFLGVFCSAGWRAVPVYIPWTVQESRQEVPGPLRKRQRGAGLRPTGLRYWPTLHALSDDPPSLGSTPSFTGVRWPEQTLSPPPGSFIRRKHSNKKHSTELLCQTFLIISTHCCWFKMWTTVAYILI